MLKIHENDAPKVKFESPNARTIKHLIAPWTLGSQNIWLGAVVVEPGNTSNLHSHEQIEEVFYCISGAGVIKVGDEEEILSPGTAVLVPPGKHHQLINNSDDQLKVMAITSPPFTPEGFQKDHELKTDS